MATDFPNNPANGATHTFGGTVYTYSTSVGAWTAGSSAGGASVTVSETAPSSPAEGDLWFDPSVLKTFVYYNDGTANQWVQNNPTGGGGSSGGGASVTASDTAPSSPSAGDLWYKSDTNALYVYYNDGDSSQWVGVSGPTGAAGVDGVDGVDAAGITKSASDPTITTNGSVGDLWLNTTNGEMYALTDATSNDNVWTNIGEGTGNISSVLVASGGTETTYTSNNINYKVHTFTSSGTFTVSNSGEVDYLVIAGGGSGGAQHGGGGGAGGYRAGSNFSVPAGSYSITVGAGGAFATGASPNSGSSGTNSVFSSITSLGGGWGEGWSAGAGNTAGSGGSGGGASLNGTGGAGTSGQGYAGGSSTSSSTFPNGGGGGGGSAGVGEDSINLSRAGNGGSGTASTITGTSVTRAGGGGGGSHSPYAIGTGGSGGGGDGGIGNSGAGVAGVVNTGSGGGGSGSNASNSGAGASGIVILRYIT